MRVICTLNFPELIPKINYLHLSVLYVIVHM
jgi:hypothetical protein